MRRVCLLLLLLFCLATVSTTAVQPIHAQDSAPETDTLYREQAALLLDTLSPAERVGQLFVITFEGSTLANEDFLAQIIRENYIGGVVLTAENNNFSDEVELDRQIVQLTHTLQELATTGQIAELEPALPEADEIDRPPTPEPTPEPLPLNESIPLFITMYGSENGRSTLLADEMRGPNLMSLGATWNVDHAAAAGESHGTQLASFGVNLLLAPALDVLSHPQVVSSERSITQFFGGNPYWVGEMGQAYINGVQLGSNGRVATIATLFPGSGHSDRPTHAEIATIRKSLPQLELDELVPFTNIVSHRTMTQTAVGLLNGHLRYQGLQGNIGTNTPPFSFDPQAIDALLSLPQFASWRSQGGLMMSDALGASAVARFYDSTGEGFPHRQVAKDALLAGNDLLFAANFTSDGTSGETHLLNVQDTLNWFRDRYQTDPAFQVRVDEAVLRILETKLHLYEGDLSSAHVLSATAAAIDSEDRSEETDATTDTVELDISANGVMFSVAQDAISLLAPTADELLDRLPNPPAVNENIVIFTELSAVQQCETCVTQFLIDETEFGEQIVNLYGPSGSGQIEETQIQSFSFADLSAYLDTPRPIAPLADEATAVAPVDLTVDPNLTPTPTFPADAFAVQQALDGADWIIIALLDDKSSALHQLLADVPVWQDRKLVVYAFGDPTHLDSTEISKLTAYFGVYDHHPSFIDASVRTLFRDLTLQGASPISIEALGYDLDDITQPNPDQVIRLTILETVETAENGEQEENVPIKLEPGATLRLQAGPVLDRNGRVVPDGTLVQFIQEDRVQGFFDVISEGVTVDGVARFDYVLEDRPGQFRLRASAGDAISSEQVDIAITGEEEASVVLITPTPLPTSTPTPTIIPTITIAPTETATPIATPIPDAPPPTNQPQLSITLTDVWHLTALLLGLLIVSLVSGRLPLKPAPRLKITAWGWILGLLGYIYHMLALPGLTWLPNWGNWLSLLVAIVAGLCGVLLSLIALFIQVRRAGLEMSQVTKIS